MQKQLIIIDIPVHALKHMCICKLHVSLIMFAIKYVYGDIITRGMHSNDSFIQTKSILAETPNEDCRQAVAYHLHAITCHLHAICFQMIFPNFPKPAI